jgi:nitric oxide reductase NorD protein
MSEPEDLIVEGAMHAAVVVRELWRRRSENRGDEHLPLARVRRRLELLSSAAFPGTREIAAVEAPAPISVLWRLAYGGSRSRPVGLACTDGERIWLPRELDAPSPAVALQQYRLLVLEQAARAARGTSRERSSDPLIRDLYLLRESAAVDALLARTLPGLGRALRVARDQALAERITPRRRAEQVVEELTRALLAADLLRPPAALAESATPSCSMDWARREATHLRTEHGRYRGIAPVALWGGPPPVPDDLLAWKHTDPTDEHRAPRRTQTMLRRPRGRAAGDEEDDATEGTWIVRTDDPQEKVEDAGGLQRPTDRDADANPGELADAISELPELRIVRTPQPVTETLVSENPLRRDAAANRVGTLFRAGVAYPEWDWRANVYRPRAAIVRPCEAPSGDPTWAPRVLRRHAALVHAVRRDFERLRARRSTRSRQQKGAEIDVDAYVVARADARGAGSTDDRWYIDARPRRRDLAIALLLDASASTDGWVAANRRVIDVEKEALLVVCEALRILGDPHAVLAFSGEGPDRVQVRQIVGFDDTASVEAVRSRIAAVEPDGFTRLGTALRHATALLSRRTAHRRLLLLLSDGRPNDVDVYEGRYGVEDTRAAVAEARLAGVYCFCLTVDREAPRYAPRIFGAPYFAVLPHPERLPTVVLGLLRRLIRTQ